MFKNILIVLLLSLICIKAGTFDLGIVPSPSCTATSQELDTAFTPVGNCASSIVNNQYISTPSPSNPPSAYGHFALCRTYDDYGNSQYIMSYVADNDTSNTVSLDCPSSGDLITFTVALIPTFNVSGEVIDVTTGDPVSGAVVSVGDVQFTTGADGKYTLLVVNGTNTIIVSASPYVTNITTVVITQDTVLNFFISPPPYIIIYTLWDDPNSNVSSYYYIKDGCTITLDDPACACAGSGGENIVPTLYSLFLTKLIGCNAPALFAVYPTLAPEETPITLVEVQITTLEGQQSWTRNITDFSGPNLGYWRVFETTAAGDIYVINDIVSSDPTEGIF